MLFCRVLITVVHVRLLRVL